MDIDLIGMPIDHGAGRRGVDMGPSAIRYAGLAEKLVSLGHSVRDLGNVEMPILETCTADEPQLRYIHCIVPAARRLMGEVMRSVRAGRIPLTLGGDHSLSLGSIRGAARGRRLGVLWIDAHGDFNTDETTPSGNIHGMVLAALCGFGDPRLVDLIQSPGDEPAGILAPENVVLIGARDLDSGERALLAESAVNVFSMHDVDRLGMAQVMEKALTLALHGADALYLSFDLDSIDPMTAPGVGTAVDGGLTYREAHLVSEMVAESGRLIGMDLVEVNPILDIRNRTARMAINLALSALGERIW